jgi:hypothetical protein
MLLAALAVVAHVGWLTFSRTNATPPPDGVSAAAQHNSAAADWIRSNLPSGLRVLSDGFDPPAGYRPVSLSTAGKNWTNYSYLLTVATAEPPAGSALGTVWRSSTPVAVFDDVQVRLVLPVTPADQILRDRDEDRVERLRAGAALQSNPQLVSSPSIKAILVAGGLDLRAAAALTAVVGQVPVTLNKIDVVPAEVAAAIPARTVTIYSSDPAAVTRALSGLASTFAPDQVTVGENGAMDLHWSLSVTPIPSVN